MINKLQDYIKIQIEALLPIVNSDSKSAYIKGRFEMAKDISDKIEGLLFKERNMFNPAQPSADHCITSEHGLPIMQHIPPMPKVKPPKNILEQGYRPEGMLDTTKPPQGGSAVSSKFYCSTFTGDNGLKCRCLRIEECPHYPKGK